MARKDDEEPTLGEAWTMLGEQLGLSVEQRGERSIRATGTVRGRAVTVDIEGDGRSGRKEFGRFFAGLNTISSRNQREKWRTSLTVGCTDPGGVTGTIESSVGVHFARTCGHRISSRDFTHEARPVCVARVRGGTVPDIHEVASGVSSAWRD